jgi:hypothetical protein
VARLYAKSGRPAASKRGRGTQCVQLPTLPARKLSA